MNTEPSATTTTSTNANSSSTTGNSSGLTKATVSNGDPSRYELIAFISHMGESTAVSPL